MCSNQAGEAWEGYGATATVVVLYLIILLIIPQTWFLQVTKSKSHLISSSVNTLKWVWTSSSIHFFIPSFLHFQSKAYRNEINWLKHGHQSAFYSTWPQASWIPGNLKSPTPTRFLFKEFGFEGFVFLSDNFSGKPPSLKQNPHQLISPSVVCPTKSKGFGWLAVPPDFTTILPAQEILITEKMWLFVCSSEMRT